MLGSYLYPYEKRLFVSCCGDGLVQPQGTVMATFNTTGTECCMTAVDKALAKYPNPDIVNMDQGSQFTSATFTGVLQEKNIQISMGGRRRCLENVCIKRLWRSLTDEDIYLKNYKTGAEARIGIDRWIGFYNTLRPHSSLGGIPPDTFYLGLLENAA